MHADFAIPPARLASGFYGEETLTLGERQQRDQTRTLFALYSPSPPTSHIPDNDSLFFPPSNEMDAPHSSQSSRKRRRHTFEDDEYQDIIHEPVASIERDDGLPTVDSRDPKPGVRGVSRHVTGIDDLQEYPRSITLQSEIPPALMQSQSPRSTRLKRSRVEFDPSFDDIAISDDNSHDHDSGNDDHGASEPQSGRGLRKRKPWQKMPFKYDKLQHKISQSSGRAATAGDIETALRRESTVAKRLRKRKKATATARPISTVAAAAPEPTMPAPSHGGQDLAMDDHSSQPQPLRVPVQESSTEVERERGEREEVRAANPREERTLLKVRLDKFGPGAVPLKLSHCRNVDQLMERIEDAWAFALDGRTISHAVGSFPWLDDSHDILLRAGHDGGFEQLVRETQVEMAWKSLSPSGDCEVKIMVYTAVPTSDARERGRRRTAMQR